MANIGYARVSTADQNLDAQIDELARHGCSRVFADTASGTLNERPQLAACLDHLRDGDTLTVVRLDRLGRSVPHLVQVTNEIAERGIGFASLREAIDTTTAVGRLFFHVMAGLAQFERDLIVDRTMAGLASARARGRKGGRRAVLTGDKLTTARNLYKEGKMTVQQIAEVVGVSRASIYRAL